MPGNRKKKKSGGGGAKYFQHFPLLFSLFIILHSEETGHPEIPSLQEISKRKALGIVCEIFFFCLDAFFCLLCDGTLTLLPLGKLSHLIEEILVTGGLVRV